MAWSAVTHSMSSCRFIFCFKYSMIVLSISSNICCFFSDCPSCPAVSGAFIIMKNLFELS